MNTLRANLSPQPYSYRVTRSPQSLFLDPPFVSIVDLLCRLSRCLPLLLLLGELGVVLGEALAQALGLGHLLLDAAGDAARLAVGQGLGGEVVDARDEAVVHEVSKDVHKVLHLALLQALLERALLGGCESVRCVSALEDSGSGVVCTYPMPSMLNMGFYICSDLGRRGALWWKMVVLFEVAGSFRRESWL